MTILRFSGADAKALLLDLRDQHSDVIRSTLSVFDADSATAAWMEALRGIEEFINIPMFGLDDGKIVRELLAVRLDDMMLPMRVSRAREMLFAKLAPAVIDRLVQTLILMIAFGQKWRRSGWRLKLSLRQNRNAEYWDEARQGHVRTLSDAICPTHPGCAQARWHVSRVILRARHRPESDDVSTGARLCCNDRLARAGRSTH